MSNGRSERQEGYAQILSENRARLGANSADLQSVGRTTCKGGYALELIAPRSIRFTSALRQSTAAPADALFWIIRVPDHPAVAEVSITVPNAWDKPDWYAERHVDEGWAPVHKPASSGAAHAALADSPSTFHLADAQGDIVLPVPLAGPLSRVMVDPEPGIYRVHFAPFTATIGGDTCSFNARAWEVTLR